MGRNITEEGIYPATITEAYVAEMAASEKHPEVRHQIVVVGTTENGDTGTWYGPLTRTVIQGGQHKGKYAWQATMAALAALGYKGDDPFGIDASIDNGGLVGASCKLKVEADYYGVKEGNPPRYKVAYIWPDSGSPTKVDKTQAKSVWDAITGGTSAPPPAAPKTEAEEAAALLGTNVDPDDLPF